MELFRSFLLRKRTFSTGLLLLLLLGHREASAQVVPGLPQISLQFEAGGLIQPLHIAHAGDGSGRLFVVEQGGRIRIIRNKVLLSTPFLNISDRVSCCGERGLLSVAFPPRYAGKGYFYVNYTDLSGNTVVARYRVSADPDIADPASEEVILTVAQPFANHNGGLVAFGPDGFLYIGMGDGGSGGDPNNFAQNLDDLPGNQRLLGKMLRIDVESGVRPYAIPLSNPLLNGRRSEVWALGLRNPWRFSFDRLTGDLFIGDVGQNRFEEIDFQPASSGGGENYGWRIMEGAHCFNPDPCNQVGLVLPVTEYDHSGGCSVTGGHVYRGKNFPRMEGIYFYSDFCSGTILGLRRSGPAWENLSLLSSGLSVTTFGEDESGNLYLSDYQGGNILRVIDSFSVMALPEAQETFSYPPFAFPVPNILPEEAKPVGVGPVASGGSNVSLRVDLPRLSGPSDVYFGISAPAIDPVNIYLLRPDNTFQNVSAGLVPWNANTSGPLVESLFGVAAVSTLPSGIYDLYLAVAPAGRIDNYYLWSTFFVIP